MAEWLRRWTANPIRSPCVGSNPISVETFCSHELIYELISSISDALRAIHEFYRDIHLPDKVKETMQLLVEAERKKKAAITESEGKREAEVR